MLHLRSIPQEAKRCDLRVRDAIRRETNECLRKDLRLEPYTPPARFAKEKGVEVGEPAKQPWHAYNND